MPVPEIGPGSLASKSGLLTTAPTRTGYSDYKLTPNKEALWYVT